jgi:ribose/xylose/arabinose/galactoside ABC-type transport system permease subunit
MGQVLVPEPSGPRVRELVRAQSDPRRRWLQAAAIWIVLGALVLIASLVSPNFLAPRNITTILKQAAPLGILAIGETLVILTGGIDLSVASVMASVSIFAAGITDGQDELVVPVVAFCLLF